MVQKKKQERCIRCSVRLVKGKNIYTSWWNKKRSQRVCKRCCNKYNRAWFRKNKTKRRQYGIEKNKRIRAEVLTAYGGKCSCCGETEPVMLDIDHINRAHGGSSKHKKGVDLYLWLRKKGFPKDKFRCLCRNCNWAVYSLGACPHKDKKLSGIISNYTNKRSK